MSSRPRRSALLVFAKAPEPGTVKTRLIPLLGKETAAKLYSALLVNCIAMATQWQNQGIQLWCFPDGTHPWFTRLQKNFPLTLHTQVGNDLGQRMHYAFQQALKDFDAAVIIGSDCPTINAALLDQAFQALYAGKDAVIAPAEDGGYVLMGLKKPVWTLFSDIHWGTGQVFEQTQQRLQQLQLSWQALDVQWDVDRPVDLERLIGESRYQWQAELRSVINTVKKTVG